MEMINVAFFLSLILGSSDVSGATLTTKTITYRGNSDLEHEIGSLCGKLVPTLERLESLNEVRVSA